MSPIKLLLSSLFCMLPCACTHWSPVHDRTSGNLPIPSSSAKDLTATYMGNTTILITDGSTNLLVDGFFSRPGKIPTFLGKIRPNEGEIRDRLKQAHISKVDAILVGHAHHDHALDAPTVSQITRARVYGSESYQQIHFGHLGPEGKNNLQVVRKELESFEINEFTVTFVKSDHIPAGKRIQELVEGEITHPVSKCDRFYEYKCGEVYALHIAHRLGNIAITTTAGSKAGQFKGLKADTVFLGIGTLAKQGDCYLEKYWKDTVEDLGSTVVAPVHWDDFSVKLTKGLRPLPKLADDVKKSFQWLEQKSAGRRLMIMNAYETTLIGKSAGN